VWHAQNPLLTLGGSIGAMAESDDIETLRAERDAAIKRAEEAEAVVSVRTRAIAAGIPPEIAATFAGPMTDEEFADYSERFRDWVAESVEEALQEARPDRRRNGAFVVQNLDAIEPDWLRDRLRARSRR
jgi:hypothetical protein